MLTVVTLLKRHHVAPGEGDRPFWTFWGAEYLAKLVRGVRRFIGDDVRIVCLTDSPDYMPEGVEPIALARPEDPSWWNKLQMFAEETGLTGRCLYLDLDNVIAGDLSDLVSLAPSPLIMTDDEVYPRLPNGSTILFDADHPACRALWTEYVQAPEAIRKAFTAWPNASDQAYIAASLCASFGPPVLFQHVLPRGYLLNGQLMERGAPWEHIPRLVFGCSHTKPHSSSHPFYVQHWRAAA